MTRSEFDHVIDILNVRGDIINDIRQELDVQLRRMAQLQAELDEVRLAWRKITLPHSPGKSRR